LEFAHRRPPCIPTAGDRLRACPTDGLGSCPTVGPGCDCAVRRSAACQAVEAGRRARTCHPVAFAGLAAGATCAAAVARQQRCCRTALQRLRLVLTRGTNRPASGGEPGGAQAVGKEIIKVAPRPGGDSTRISPPLWTIRLWAIDRPRPVPPSRCLVVKNGSKIRPR